MPRKLTPLTDPDNLMVIWDEPEPEPKRPVKKAAKKVTRKAS